MQNPVQQALFFIQQNQPKKAVALCKPLHRQQPNNPQVALILAVALGASGDFDKSHKLFKTLQQAHPQNPEVAYNRALIYQQQGRASAALQQYKKCISLQPRHASALNNAAIIEQSQGHFEQAIEGFQRAIELAPDALNYRVNLAQCLHQCGQYSRAVETMGPVLERRPRSEDWVLVLDALYKQRDTLKAVACSRDAMAMYPNDPDVLLLAGQIESDNKKHRLAIRLLERARQNSATDNVELQASLITARQMLGEAESDLQTSLDALIHSDPHNCFSHEFAASLSESSGQLEACETYITEGLIACPDNLKLKQLSARLASRQKQFAPALSQFEALLQADLAPTMRTEVLLEMARCHNSAGDADAAWSCITRANALNQGEVHDRAQALFHEKTRELAQQIKTHLDSGQPWPCSDCTADPVFIIGFPRSGTTLLETILDEHPDVAVLEETHAITALHERVQKDAGRDGNVFAHLHSLSVPQRSALAQSYLDDLDDYLRLDGRSCIVDKMPMNAMYAAFIHCLFPRARFIFAQRNPLDVCLSCLMQDMLQVYSVEAACAVYDDLMRLWDTQRRALPLSCRVLRYEDFVADVAQQSEAMFDFLGLTWDPAYLQYHQRQGRPMVNTPSYQQVSEAVNTRAINRHQKFPEFTARAEPLLRPWLEAFAYHND